MYGKCIKDESKSIIVIDSPGCSWGKCAFCAVKHQVAQPDVAIQQINDLFKLIPDNETKLQIVSSASFSDYDDSVINAIFNQVSCKQINTLIVEQRWGLRDQIQAITDVFGTIGVSVEWILGLETMSCEGRAFLGKEPYEANCSDIRRYFQRVNLLYGYKEKPFSLLKSEVDALYNDFDVISINLYEDVPGSYIHRDVSRIEEFYNSDDFCGWLNDPKIHIFDIDPRAQSDFGGIDTFKRN